MLTASLQLTAAANAQVPAAEETQSPDGVFVRSALQAGTQTVADAKQAAMHARRGEVRALARRITRHQQAINLELATVIQGAEGMPQLPIVVKTTQIDAQDYDRSYLSLQASADEQSISQFQQYAAVNADVNANTSPELRKYAVEILPLLKRRLAALKRLQTRPQR